ncbi:MAG: alpha-amylase [Myxococcales bacterium]|nr:alpha-amylase [Myxococcales bacterium]
MKKITFAALACALAAAACHTPEPGIAGERRITPGSTDWRDEVIYQVFVDRFANGDYSNDFGVDRTHMGRYHGGDWQGLIKRIPYLKKLGVTAIWISPVVKNIEEDAGFAGYHGYWTQDFLSVNQHFGDLAKMQELVDQLHDNGFKVILDIVTNHIGPLFYYDVNMNGRADDILFGGGGASYGSRNPDNPGKLTRTSEWDPDYDSRGIQSFTSLGEAGRAPIVWVYQPKIGRVPVQPEFFQNPAWYHRRGRITVWENKPPLGGEFCPTAPENNTELCPYLREQETKGDFPGGLKDLATERDDVRQALIGVFKYWIEVGDFDGFRIDTLKHVEHGFWEQFGPAMRAHAVGLGKKTFFMFGEAFSGADSLLASYTDREQVDSVFYFSQKYRVFDNVFKHGGPTREIERLHQDRVRLYHDRPHQSGIGVAPRDALVNFIDNHDVERFLNNTGDDGVQRLGVALTYLLTTVGIPCIYYGTEQQFDGGNDPSNREDMWLGNRKRGLSPYDTTNDTFMRISGLTKLRKEHAALRRGSFEIRWSTDHTGTEDDAGIFAFERQHEGDHVLVAVNAHQCDDKKSSRTRDGANLMKTGFAAGTKLTDMMPDGAGGTFTVGQDGTLDVDVPCLGARILVKQ